MSVVKELYVDGGVVLVNPSPYAGTWAYCHVGADGERLTEQCGLIMPCYGLNYVTNNQAEVAALTYGLHSLPRGWSGYVYSDSKLALGWAFKGFNPENLPPVMYEDLMGGVKRLGVVSAILLDGHPTKAQLESGVGKRGNPVSEHNDWCDRACKKEAAEYCERTGARLPTPLGKIVAFID